MLLSEIEGARGIRLDLESIARKIGLSIRDSRSLISALSGAIGLLTETPVSLDDFVNVGRETLFAKNDEPAARVVADLVIARRANLKRSLDRQTLASSVLPSLTLFELTVDARFKFVGDSIEDTVPVAIVHIDTDAEKEELWLQLTRSDAERMTKQLADAIKQMDIVEKLINLRSSDGGSSHDQ